MNNTLNVVELFAGVGGFRVGLEKADKKLFDTVWANQWEPSKKAQDAFYHFKTSNFRYRVFLTKPVSSIIS